MPMGGGTFVLQNKTLPGAYINFKGTSNTLITGVTGVAALPLALKWGATGTILRVDADTFARTALTTFGYAADDPELLLIREALKGAKSLLVYRVGGGAKASLTSGGVTATAKYPGSRGNAIKVAIRAIPDDNTNVEVITYLDTVAVDTQVTPKASPSLKGNAFVDFGSATSLTAATAAALTGGTNTDATGSDYTAFLAALELQNFNSVGYPGADSTVKALVAAFVKRLRNDEGRKVVGVLYQYAGDDMGLISVKNGVVVDGVTLSSGAVCWVTGKTAAAAINESLTNQAYAGAEDVDVRYTKSQYEDAIRAGEFVFYADLDGSVRVLADINSLVTLQDGMSDAWTSNRVVRVMDAWANDTAALFGSRYLGNMTNNVTGRQLFLADLVALGTRYQALGAISDFTSNDVSVTEGSGKRDVQVSVALKPNDSMEKLYMEVSVA